MGLDRCKLLLISEMVIYVHNYNIFANVKGQSRAVNLEALSRTGVFCPEVLWQSLQRGKLSLGFSRTDIIVVE